MKYLLLYENLQSQKSIEKLAVLIINGLTNRNIKYDKWNEDNFYEFKNKTDEFISLFVTFNVTTGIDVVAKNFNREFQKYIKDKKNWLNVNIENKNSNIKGQYQKFSHAEITLFYTKNEIDDYLEDIDNDFTNIKYSNLEKFLSLRKESLIHELQHSFDDWRSKGKYIDTKKYNSWTMKHGTKDEQYTKYATSPHEISAFFTGIISKIIDFSYNPKYDSYYKNFKLDNWESVYTEFKDLFPKWEEQTNDVKKRLTNRLYVAWQDKVGNKKESIDVTEKLSKLVTELRDKYGKDIYIRYTHFNNQIDIDELKVNSIKDEKDIYKKVIWFADRYQKILTLDLYKGFTTSALGKAKEYLKDFGFFANKGSKMDYRFREGWLRYTKRK